mmetsp:Transcript_47763/g.117128  ORF Transcript_47763/g.117128 Transcript_47763/m.117128 type:complete len:320 (+) Transcript_47763:26-985(+)
MLRCFGCVRPDVTSSEPARIAQEAERQEELGKEAVDYLSEKPKGVSVEFLVTHFDRELERLFPDKYDEATTFVQLADWLWGPPDSDGRRGFERPVDLFGHVRMIGSSREGKAGVSLCTAIGQRFPSAVSCATHFISWSWRYSIKKFIRALQAYCAGHNNTASGCFVWVCFICNNQFEWLQDGGKDGVAEFGTNLEKIGRLTCVVDEFLESQAVYVQRLWPVFEVFAASSQGVTIDVALMGVTPQQLAREPLSTFSRGLVVDVLSTTATDPKDEQRIKMLIANDSGAANATNEVVQLVLFDLISFLIKLILKSSYLRDGS